MDPSSSSSSSYLPNLATTSSSLHAVRKLPAKPWRKPIAPPQLPPPISVYWVESSNFRKVVQELTGAPKFKPNRLRRLAPPPISLIKEPTSSHRGASEPVPQQSHDDREERPSREAFDIDFLPSEALGIDPIKKLFGSSSPSAATASLGLLSPSWYSWCSASSPLPSPGTLASLWA